MAGRVGPSAFALCALLLCATGAPLASVLACPSDAESVDRFGVTMLNPSPPDSENFFLNDGATDPDEDSQFNPRTPLSPNPDGSWKAQSTQVRMHVYTSSGFESTDIATLDREILATQGYMLAPNDWRNVEITGFFKVNQASTLKDSITLYARGARHTDEVPCEGSAYRGALFFDGRARLYKESWHAIYQQTSYVQATTPILGRWVGLKLVVRNAPSTKGTMVQLELWLNDNGDGVTWKKIHERVDGGFWGGDAITCGGLVAGMPITWGGPIVVYRWDSASDVDFKWLSVREIQ